MTRGDVVLVRFPHPSGLRGKRRPAVVVQADKYAGKISTVVLALVTTNLSMAADPACLLIEFNTPDGRATGVLSDCVVTALHLGTVNTGSAQIIGKLSVSALQQFNDCLKAALAIP
jgi:mRNA interferase MazF